MDGVAGPGIVVWQRAPDDAASARRWRRLIRWYSAPAIVALVGAVVLGGVGALLVVAIALGALAGVLALGVWAYDYNRRDHTEIRLVDGCLVLGGARVRVDAIEAWTTLRHAATSGTTTGAAVSAVFRVPIVDGDDRDARRDDGPAFELIRFGWPDMPEPDLDDLRASLAAHVAAPWVPVDRISD